ncbi:MAG: acyl-CoA carboxylase subunit epsilon [Nocardioides sp.]
MSADQPALRILTPDTTAEEVAAIVAVLSATSGTQTSGVEPRSEWADPARGLRTPVRPSGWKASALPR